MTESVKEPLWFLIASFIGGPMVFIGFYLFFRFRLFPRWEKESRQKSVGKPAPL